MSKLIKGIAASDGVAIAKAYLIVEPDLSYDSNEKVTDQFRPTFDQALMLVSGFVFTIYFAINYFMLKQ